MGIPNFFIIGAPKCGTTSMHEWLSSHPEIYMSAVKEPHYFGSDLTRRGRIFNRTYKEYISLFTSASSEKILGESSIFYLFSESAADEIYKFNPRSKILIMLRDPVEIIYALHSENLLWGNEDCTDFNEALALEEKRKHGNNIPSACSLLESLLYREYVYRIPKHIQIYLDMFGKENVLILYMEDLKADATGTYKKVLRFLGVSQNHEISLKAKNTAKINRSIFVAGILNKYAYMLRPFRKVISDKPLGIVNFIRKRNQKIHLRKRLDNRTKKLLRKEFSQVVSEIENITGRALVQWDSESS